MDDAAQDATYLPLLQVTLEALWERGRLTLDRYGTLTDALEASAEAAYSREWPRVSRAPRPSGPR